MLLRILWGMTLPLEQPLEGEERLLDEERVTTACASTLSWTSLKADSGQATESPASTARGPGGTCCKNVCRRLWTATSSLTAALQVTGQNTT